MSRRRTHEEYMELMSELHPDIDVLGTYVNSATAVRLQCRTCGHEWDAMPPKSLQGQGCRKCAGSLPLTHEIFMERIKKLNPTYEIRDTYCGTATPLRCRCLVDGHEWMARPADLMKGKGCARCAGICKKTTQEFIAELQLVSNTIEVIGNYTSANKPIAVRCTIDGYQWEATPSNLLRSCGCPKCNVNASKGERRVGAYLKKNNIDFVPQHRFSDCKHKRVLPFDFYLPQHRIAIEYDGEQHYRPRTYGSHDGFVLLAETQSRDAIKTRYCEEHDIKLIRIPYTEFDKIEDILDKQLA